MYFFGIAKLCFKELRGCKKMLSEKKREFAGESREFAGIAWGGYVVAYPHPSRRTTDSKQAAAVLYHLELLPFFAS